ENDLRKAALRCDGDAEATYACLGKRPNCGQCLEEAQEIIDAERAAARCDFLAVEAA
ncbi:MAG: ferredoxin, partial [Sphingomonadaceae bacterium]|nr:ferredoxin [Sphingomonadaceae bacterium]